MGSGAHDHQCSGAIPAQLSQTDLIVTCETAPLYVFFTCYLILFWGKLFAHGFGRCSRVEYVCSEMT